VTAGGAPTLATGWPRPPRPSWGALTATPVMWTERYGPPLASCADLGHAIAWFGTPVADGTVVPLHHDNFVAANPGCPGSSVHDSDGGVLHVMGAIGQPGTVP